MQWKYELFLIFERMYGGKWFINCWKQNCLKKVESFLKVNVVRIWRYLKKI